VPKHNTKYLSLCNTKQTLGTFCFLLQACQKLLAAVIPGDVNTVKILVKCANHNCTTDVHWHYTPLMYAAANSQVMMLRVLLEGGARVDMANDKQWTALHVAAWFGHLDVCRLLLDWGGNVAVVNWWNNSPLYWAA
jgi:ankyrin repeat protein